MSSLIYYTIYLVLNFSAALFLFKKYSFFQKAKGFLVLLIIGIFASVIHNFLYALFFYVDEKDEPIFFIIAILSLSIGFFLFWIWLIKLVKNKTIIALIIIIVLIAILIFPLFKFKNNLEVSPEGSNKKEEKFCENLCGDAICQEIVCMAIGCPCVETIEVCPQDCK